MGTRTAASSSGWAFLWAAMVAGCSGQLTLGESADAPASAAASVGDTRCFPTGQCTSGALLQYWEENGGEQVFGYAISPQQVGTADGWTGPLQWFERDRLEDHGALGVMGGRVGVRWLELNGRPWEQLPKVAAAPEVCDFFPQTGHSLCEPFRSYWHERGGLARFGYPISQPMFERLGEWAGTTQYFERRRMEHHTELAGTPYEILLGRLGAEVLEVERRNRAPILSAFTATPDSALIPFTSTFTWTVSDPDGQRLSCALDVGADGSVEASWSTCTTGLRYAYAFTRRGAVDVRLTVRDVVGSTVSRTVRVTPRAPPPDLFVKKVEWAQTVVDEDLRLVAGKPALLRAHVLADQPEVTGVTVRATLLRSGIPLGSLELVGPPTVPTVLAPENLEQQFRGMVPGVWIVPGLEVRVTVDPANEIAETRESNNTFSVKPSVGQATVLHLTSVPIVHQGTTGTVFNTEPSLLGSWPLASVSNQTRAPYTFGSKLTAGRWEEWRQLLAELAAARLADGSARHYLGFVQVSYGGGIAGMGYIGGLPVAVVRADSVGALLHELGHNFGRPHAPCGGPDQPDPSYPYPVGGLGSWGYDPASQKLISPATTFDVMSYCGPTWTSDYSYAAAQSYLEAHPPLKVMPVSSGPAAEHLLVRGAIRNGQVTLQPIHRLWVASPQASRGNRVLRLFSEASVQEASFEPEEVEGAPGEQHFEVLVPPPARLTALEVLEDGRTLLHRSVPEVLGAPSVSLVEGPHGLTLRWDAARFPFAALAHWSEGERTTLAWSLEGGEARVATDGLSEGGAFEISLSDGLNAVRTVLPRR